MRRGDKTSYDRIAKRQYRWLWEGYIPLNEVTMIDGMGETGKTTMISSLVASVSKGRPFPLSDEKSKPGSVLLLSSEDDPNSVTKGRLETAGAKLPNVYQLNEIGRWIDLRTDMEWLAKQITADVRMLVIDPIHAYTSMHNVRLRETLNGLHILARENSVAVLIVNHWTKSVTEKTDPKNRAFGGLVLSSRLRQMLSVGLHPEQKDVRVLAVTKCSNGAPQSSLGFAITELVKGGVIIDWLGALPDVTAWDLTASTGSGATRFEKPKKLEACKKLVYGMFDNKSSIKTAVIASKCVRAGYSPRVAQRAKDDLVREGILGHRQNGRTHEHYIPRATNLRSITNTRTRD